MINNDEIPPSQAYFWTNEWQEAEREADDDIEACRVKEFKSGKEAAEYLRHVYEDRDVLRNP